MRERNSQKRLFYSLFVYHYIWLKSRTSLTQKGNVANNLTTFKDFHIYQLMRKPHCYKPLCLIYLILKHLKNSCYFFLFIANLRKCKEWIWRKNQRINLLVLAIFLENDNENSTLCQKKTLSDRDLAEWGDVSWTVSI